MKISVYFTPLGVNPSDVEGRPVLVLDILRTTTTIVAALANGAKDIVPVDGSDEAIRIAQNLERDGVLLAGERKAQRISGFDLGNSPLEMTAEAVAGKTLVMSTTNGTRALLAAQTGDPVMVGAATNFEAVATRARELFAERGELVVLCAGRQRMFALEDAYAAGRFAQAVIPQGQRRSVELNDAGLVALEIIKRYGDKWKRAVAASAAARDLNAIGLKQDVLAATECDGYDIVPLYSGHRVTLAPRE
jgi:2-phosphosulfolactate phosphatase